MYLSTVHIYNLILHIILYNLILYIPSQNKLVEVTTKSLSSTLTGFHFPLWTFTRRIDPFLQKVKLFQVIHLK